MRMKEETSNSEILKRGGGESLAVHNQQTLHRCPALASLKLITLAITTRCKATFWKVLHQ